MNFEIVRETSFIYKFFVVNLETNCGCWGFEIKIYFKES